MLLVMPLGCCNLDENIIVQVVAFWGMIAGIGVFAWYFIWGQPGDRGMDNVSRLDTKDVPVVTPDYATVLGTVMFNYAVNSTVNLNPTVAHCSALLTPTPL